MRIRTLGVILGFSLMFASAAPAAAQMLDDRPVLGAGVSFLRNEGETATGFFVDFAGTFATMENFSLAGVGDFSYHTTNDIDISSYMGGVRVNAFGNEQFKVFGQVLLGIERFAGENDFAWQPGVGVDVRLTDMINFRGQLDFRQVRFETFPGETVTDNEARFSFGISIPVGQR